MASPGCPAIELAQMAFVMSVFASPGSSATAASSSRTDATQSRLLARIRDIMRCAAGNPGSSCTARSAASRARDPGRLCIADPRGRIARVEVDRAPVVGRRLVMVFRRMSFEEVAPLESERIGVDLRGRRAIADPSRLQLNVERARYRAGNLVLHLENVAGIALVTPGPADVAVIGPNKLSGDPDLLAGFSHRAFQNVADVKCLRDLGDRYALALERERRSLCGHLQARQPRELVDDLAGKAVGKVLLVVFLAEVCKRQHGD